MINKIRESLWQQFGASIKMLENVISNYPINSFEDNKRFYYLAYHSIVFLDYYTTIPPKAFSPILPFTIQPPHQRPAASIGDMIPDKMYSKQQLLGYLQTTRLKCKALVDSLTTEESLDKRFTEGNEKGDMDYPIVEILLYNLRHTQHHVGQLNLLIRQNFDEHMEWVFRTDE